MKRVISYIDGFNLYFGLKGKGWTRYYWLNIKKLSENLLEKDQQLLLTKYFTARISYPPDKVKRQGTFIEALETLPNLEIFYGKYQMNTQECRKCGFVWPIPNEKMTDVNIAVELLSDAFQDKFDNALLISADSDLIAPIRTVRKLFPNKKITVAFPPASSSFELIKAANAFINIGRKKIADSLFTDDVVKKDGYILKRPERWK